MNENSNRSENSRYDFELMIPFAVLASIVAIDVGGIIAVVTGRPELILGLPALIVFACLFWVIIRWVNSRGDPRTVNPPRDDC